MEEPPTLAAWRGGEESLYPVRDNADDASGSWLRRCSAKSQSSEKECDEGATLAGGLARQ